MIKINEEIYFSEKGKRDNNEDNGGWNSGIAYVVCDGVGGHEKGEIASEIVVQTFLNFNSQDASLPVDQTLVIAEKRMGQYIQKNPESKGMGTTLTIAQIKDHGINVAWVGDSRIYQFRKGNLLFQSRDHSWVNEAVDAGIISEEEAIDHPKSNIITRAIQGSHNPTKIQEKFITDIETGDVFLLCSDGVLESWNNEDFIALFTSEPNLTLLAEKIKKECRQLSKDNFTSILFSIGHVDLNVVTRNEKTKSTSKDHFTTEESSIHFDSSRAVKAKKRIKIIGLFSVLILLVLALFLMNKWATKEKSPVKGDEKHEVPASNKNKDKAKPEKDQDATKTTPKKVLLKGKSPERSIKIDKSKK